MNSKGNNGEKRRTAFPARVLAVALVAGLLLGIISGVGLGAYRWRRPARPAVVEDTLPVKWPSVTPRYPSRYRHILGMPYSWRA